MSFLLTFHRDARAASAAEFALVVPLLLLFLLGSIDVGRFMWNVNEAEKATQIGARWAVATDMIPTGLHTYSFATSGGVPQGTVVPQTSFPGVDCTATSTGGDTAPAVTCTCRAGGTCAFPTASGTQGQQAFARLWQRMRAIYSGVGAQNVGVAVRYDWSGLGYSGDPNGSDVDPLVTVEVSNLPFRPIFLGNIFNVGLPDLNYTLTMEDGQGAFAN